MLLGAADVSLDLVEIDGCDRRIEFSDFGHGNSLLQPVGACGTVGDASQQRARHDDGAASGSPLS